jgi:hypothetical protein
MIPYTDYTRFHAYNNQINHTENIMSYTNHMSVCHHGVSGQVTLLRTLFHTLLLYGLSLLCTLICEDRLLFFENDFIHWSHLYSLSLLHTLLCFTGYPSLRIISYTVHICMVYQQCAPWCAWPDYSDMYTMPRNEYTCTICHQYPRIRLHQLNSMVK